MSHLDEGTIHAWLDGALPADEAARVEAHANECAECAALVAEARGFIAGASRIVSSLDVVRGNVVPSTLGGGAAKPVANKSLWKTLKLTPARAAIAATLLVGVASMFTLRREGGVPARLADTAASAVMAPAAAPVAPTIGAVAADSIAPRGAPAPAARMESAVPAARKALAQSANPTESMKAAAPAAPATVGGTTGAVASSAVATAAPPPSQPAPAPAAADQRALRQTVAAPALTGVIATSAAEKRDSSLPARQSRRIPASAVAPSGFGAAAQNAAGAARDVATETNAVGCYRLRFDTPVDLQGFPDAFRLTRDSLSNQPMVHAIRDGRDSVLNGATWAVMPPRVVVTVGNRPATQLSFAHDSLGGTMFRNGDRFTAKVERMACPR